MSPRRLTVPLAVGLSIVYLLMGIAETIRAVLSGDGGVPFWFGSLVGGGVLILIGTLGFRDRWKPRGALVTIGCLAGAVATAWTIVLPFVAVAVIGLTVAEGQRLTE